MLRIFTVVFCSFALAAFSPCASCQEHAQRQAINHPSKGETPPAATASVAKNPITIASQQADVATHNQASPPATVRVLLPAKDRYDYFLLVLNTVLAAVGVVGLLLAGKNLKKISVQTNEIKRQADLAEKELDILVKSSEATMASADATRASVELTQKNTELYLAKESANLGISMEPWEITPDGRPVQWLGVRGRLFNYGSSTARIKKSESQLYVSENTKPSLNIASRAMEIRETLGSSDEVFLGAAIMVTRSDYEEIRAKSKFLHFGATIQYEDIFGRIRSVVAQYIWRQELDKSQSRWEEQPLE